ncbi:hypothetical protein [Amaricoccus sp. W119]
MILLCRLIRALIGLALFAATPPAEASESGSGPSRVAASVDFVAACATR